MLLLAFLHTQSGSPVTFNLPPFKPTLSSQFIYGLWFCSLSFSLFSALGASLGKSWLAEYAQIQHKPNANDANERHRRYIGISNWHLVDVIIFLPILLHTAFLLFACGLIIFLFGDNKALGAIILFLTTAAFTFYLGTAIAPLVDPDCPFRTPLTSFLVRIRSWLFNSKHASPQELSMVSKAKMLLWLQDLCQEGPDIDQIIPAIAGLDRSTGVQQLLESSSLSTMLPARLSSTDFNPKFLKEYLFVIERVGLWGTSPCNGTA